ncbi:MAG: thioesterase family protein [Bacteroidales bacterium]|nr:thioesterase family protein [Bacteroidales bacterium]
MSNLLQTTIKIRVRFSEVDSINMVWHGNYVQYLEDAREAFGHQYGMEYMHIFNSGYLAPVADIHLQYKSTASIDDELVVVITYRPTRGAKLVFDYEIRKTSDNTLVMVAETTQLFVTRNGEFEVSEPPFLTEWKKKCNV